MYGNALWQYQQHQFAACILLAQVAVEMGTRNAFIRLIALGHGSLVEDAAIKELCPTCRSWRRPRAVAGPS